MPSRLNAPPAIGVTCPRKDGGPKVTGTERYAADYYGRELVWAAAKRAGIAHGRIVAIHRDAALAIPGVLAVLTHEHVPGTNRQGVVNKDQPVLVDDKVRHRGDGVALVLAESRAVLAEALDAVTVEYEALPGLYDPGRAMAEGAPIVHEHNREGNVLLSGEVKKGKGLQALQECDIVLEQMFESPRQEHAYLETEAGWARIGEDGTLVIVCSTQTPFRDRTEVAEALGLDPVAIRIVAPYPGGAFGGKDGVSVQSLLGLAAMHSGRRPVKMWWERKESFVSSPKRHPARTVFKLGAKRDGTLHYVEMDLLLDTGPYDHLGGVVLALALEHAGGPYRVPHAWLKAACVYTNNPVSGAFRGFGVPQVAAAMEQMMDLLAGRVGMDPLAIRRKNAIHQGETSPVGATVVSSTGIVHCLDTLNAHPAWQRRHDWKTAAGPFTRRGVGMAALVHGCGYGPVVPDYANAKVELTEEGGIRVYCGVVDMGQGNASTNAQIAGSILGQPVDDIELVLPDTERTLPSGSASASRCTFTFANALIGAAQALKARIVDRGADLLFAEHPDDVVLIAGHVRYLRTGQQIPLSTIARFFNASERVAIHRFKAPTARDDLGVPDNLRLHGLPHRVFSYAAHCAWVEVDELTGEVHVSHYLAITDSGKIINPQIYEQQIQGGIAQGMGWALYEDFQVQEGTVQTVDFATYTIPTAMDVPDVESIPVELYEPTGPYGLKGVGEIATNGPAPAIANAIADAIGVRITHFPFTPERVLQAVLSVTNKGTGA